MYASFCLGRSSHGLSVPISTVGLLAQGTLCRGDILFLLLAWETWSLTLLVRIVCMVLWLLSWKEVQEEGQGPEQKVGGWGWELGDLERAGSAVKGMRWCPQTVLFPTSFMAKGGTCTETPRSREPLSPLEQGLQHGVRACCKWGTGTPHP